MKELKCAAVGMLMGMLAGTALASLGQVWDVKPVHLPLSVHYGGMRRVERFPRYPESDHGQMHYE